MNFETDESGEVRRTDYFGSNEKLKGRAWLIVIRTSWQFFLPCTPGCRLRLVQAFPVEAEEEPEGWMWCLDVDGTRYPVPVRQIQGPRPRLPDAGQVLRRACLLHVDYCATLGPWFFGAMHPGMQSRACTLHLSRVPLKIVP